MKSTEFGARYNLGRLKIIVSDDLAEALKNHAESLWPGQGDRAVNRLTRDAIRRYVWYWHDYDRDRPSK